MMAKSRLKSELKNLRDNPPEGITANIVNDDLLLWEAVITGPVGSYFEGGEFVAELDIPKNYPISPPKMKFKSEIFHPNVYESGSVCISILHTPGEDPTGHESPREQWNPQQSIEKILLSVRVILSDPNDSSPANPNAAILYRENKSEFAEQALICVQKSSEVAKLKRFREEKKKQDKEFEETRLADQKKEKEKQEKLEQQRQEKDDMCSIKRKKETEDNIEKLSVKRKTEDKTEAPSKAERVKFDLPPEPASDCGIPTVVIRFRAKDRTLPLERRFKKTDNIDTIFNFLRSEGFEPLNIELILWPNKDLCKEDKSTTLEELKLGVTENIRIRNKVYD